MTESVKADWIAVDWGTTQLRAWAMSESGTVLAHRQSDTGGQDLSGDEFEHALLDVIGGWIKGPTTVVACGTIGGRNGWVAVPYTAVPCPALPEIAQAAPTQNDDLRVHIIGGIKQNQPADLMRGEETQIAGFLARNTNWDGVLCLPGTHTKWVHVSAGEIVSFQTFLTGEMYAQLAGHPFLHKTPTADDWDHDAFLTALSDTMGRPEKLAARLFTIRAETVLNDLPAAAANAQLSGLLIGAELAAAKPYWLGQQIAVIGNSAIAKIYVDALAAQAAPATQVHADGMVIAGLTAAYRQRKG